MTDDTQREHELAEFVLGNAEHMAQPPSEWEAKVLADVIALPRVTVLRPPRAQLLALGMLPYHCHANCALQAANDPEQLSRHVSGWLIDGPDLILHSVIEMRGRWFCMTPQYVPAPPQFQFTPDPLIEWRDASDGARLAFRGGSQLPEVLRKYPEHHIRMRDELRRLIAAGMSVADARQKVDAILGAELRKLEPI